MGTCRSPDYNDVIFGSTASSENGNTNGEGDEAPGLLFSIMSTFYLVYTEGSNPIRAIVASYILIVVFVYMSLLANAFVQYITDIHRAFRPRWAYAMTGFPVTPPPHLRTETWTQSDISLLTLWSMIKFVLSGALLPIFMALLWPLWLPLVCTIIGSHIARYIYDGLVFLTITLSLYFAKMLRRYFNNKQEQEQEQEQHDSKQCILSEEYVRKW